MFQFLWKNKKKKVHFLHIGKTGGSAIKSVLKRFQETPKYSVELHGHSASLKDIPKGEAVIFFLREPVSRFVSGFYSRQRKGQPRYYSEWSPKEKKVFEQYATPNDVAVSLAQKQPSAVAAMDSVKHFSHYQNWYVDLDYFNSRADDILFIGFQESLNSDFDKLKDLLALPEGIALPTDGVEAHKNPANLDKSIDEEGVCALNEWYEEDTRFIHLCKQMMSEKLPSAVQ